MFIVSSSFYIPFSFNALLPSGVLIMRSTRSVVHHTPTAHVHYPIPHKGMGSCSSLVSCTLLLFFFCFPLDKAEFWPSFQDISMKLAGHIGHGPSSSYPDLWPDMSCCHGIMTENVLKNGQMNVRIVKSHEEMAKIHS